MIKKVLLGFLGLLLIGALVFGAVNRTTAMANYSPAGQRYGQQNPGPAIHRGWTGQEGTAKQGEQGEGWHALGHGRGQTISEEGGADQRVGPLRRGQPRGAGRSWDDTGRFVPWD